jgi:uncharacterized protein (DUF2345 family)
MKLAPEEIDAIASKLRDMPQPSTPAQLSKQGAINRLAGEIAELKTRGYSIAEIAQTLSAEGLAIAPATLKNYLQRARGGELRKRDGGRSARRNESTQAQIPKSRQPHVTNAGSRSIQASNTGAPSTAARASKATFEPSEDTSDI